MKLSLNNVVPDLRDHFDEGLCSFDELISLGVIWQPFLPSCLWNKVVICMWYMSGIMTSGGHRCIILLRRLRESINVNVPHYLQGSVYCVPMLKNNKQFAQYYFCLTYAR